MKNQHTLTPTEQFDLVCRFDPSKRDDFKDFLSSKIHADLPPSFFFEAAKREHGHGDPRKSAEAFKGKKTLLEKVGFGTHPMLKFDSIAQSAFFFFAVTPAWHPSDSFATRGSTDRPWSPATRSQMGLSRRPYHIAGANQMTLPLRLNCSTTMLRISYIIHRLRYHRSHIKCGIIVL